MMMMRRARPDTHDPDGTPERADRSVYDRRGSDRLDDDSAGAARRRAARTFRWAGETAKYIVIIGGLISALGAAIGVRYISIAKLDARVTRLEQHDGLNSYLLCILARRDAPDATPPDCAPIIDRRDGRQP